MPRGRKSKRVKKAPTKSLPPSEAALTSTNESETSTIPSVQSPKNKPLKKSRASPPENKTTLKYPELLNSAQESLRKHSSILTQIKSSGNEDIFTSIFPYLSIYLLDSKTSPQSNRIHLFFTSLFSDKEIISSQPSYLENVLKTLNLLSGSTRKLVRQKSISLMRAILDNLPEEAEISDTLFEELLKTLLLRIKDKNQIIRVEAIKAIYRLQNPDATKSLDTSNDVSFSKIIEDSNFPKDAINCPVMSSLIELSLWDESTNVRSNSIEKLAITKQTLPFLYRRHKDISPLVRSTVYKVLSSKIRMKSLKLIKRITLINSGLKDRDKTVNKECLNLIKNWIQEEPDGVLSVIKNFDEETVKEVTNALLTDFSLNSNFDLKKFLGEILKTEKSWFTFLLENLNLEKASFFKQIIFHISLNYSNFDKEEIELLNYTKILLNFYNSSISSNISTTQNFEILYFLVSALSPQTSENISQIFVYDDTSIKSLKEVLLTLLRSDQITQTELLKEIISVSSFLYNVKELNEIVMERISELYVFPNNPADINIDNNSNNSSKGENGDASNKLKEAIENRKSILSLNMLENLLTLKQNLSNLNDPILTEALNQYVLNGVVSISPFLRNISLKCLTPFVLITDYGHKYLPLLLSVLSKDQEALKLTSLKILFDFLLMKDNADQNTVTEILTATSEFLYSENNVLMGNAGEGFIKLFINGVIYDCKIFSTLVLLFFNPVTSDNNVLRQMSSLFFKYYIPSVCGCLKNEDGKEETDRRNLVYSAIIPCIKAVLNAPEESPIGEIDLAEITGFMLKLLGVCKGMENNKNKVDEVKTVYKNFFFDLGYEIIAFPERKVINEQLIRLLFKLDLSAAFKEERNKTEIFDLVKKIEKVGMTCGLNRKTARDLNSLVKRMEKEEVDEESEGEVEEEKVEEEEVLVDV